MIRRILIIAIGLGVGAGAAQAPEFIQQYTQRLGGWRDAYAQQLADLDQRATEAGLSREDYIAALRTSDDLNAVREGEYLALLPGYQAALEKAYKDLSGAAPWTRALVFAEHYNTELATRVWRDYKPAVPTTAEGVAYGGAGFLAGWLAVALAGLPYRIWRERRDLAARRNKLGGFDPL
ncbi:MAG: DUF2937 family protein [Alphaproteobacteria bacterium]|nr:DUF2937 family protein [Alphaproteobacteria bacterium]